MSRTAGSASMPRKSMSLPPQQLSPAVAAAPNNGVGVSTGCSARFWEAGRGAGVPARAAAPATAAGAGGGSKSILWCCSTVGCTATNMRGGAATEAPGKLSGPGSRAARSMPEGSITAGSCSCEARRVGASCRHPCAAEGALGGTIPPGTHGMSCRDSSVLEGSPARSLALMAADGVSPGAIALPLPVLLPLDATAAAALSLARRSLQPHLRYGVGGRAGQSLGVPDQQLVGLRGRRCQCGSAGCSPQAGSSPHLLQMKPPVLCRRQRHDSVAAHSTHVCTRSVDA